MRYITLVLLSSDIMIKDYMEKEFLELEQINQLFESSESLIDFAKSTFDLINVPYVIGGGLARAFHGTTRLTKDVDVFILTSNLKSLEETLLKNGFNKIDNLKYNKPDREIIKFKKSNHELDVLIIHNKEFEKFVFDTSNKHTVFGKELNVISIEAFILTKLMSWRNKDKADIDDVIESKTKFNINPIKHFASEFKIFDRLYILEDGLSK